MHTFPEVFNAATYFVDRHLDEGRADSIAIECGDRRITYGRLHQQVNRLGSALRNELGVRREERVVLLMLDVPEMIYTFFGAIKIGAVPIPTNTLWTTEDYKHVLIDSGARVIVVSGPLWTRVADAVRACPTIQHVVVVDREAEAVPEATDFQTLVDG